MPTGDLTLHNECWWAKRNAWNDGKRRKIESYLGEFIVSLIITANSIKNRRLEEEKAKELRLKEELKRWELEKLQNAEIEKYNSLVNAANNWQTSMLIMEYIEALESNTEMSMSNIEQKEKLAEYIKWAKSKAEWINPLTAKTDPILGNKYKK